MKKVILFLYLFCAFLQSSIAQTSPLDSSLVHPLRELGVARGAAGDAFKSTEHTGVENKILAELDKAATDLKALVPATVSNFKVFDYGAYPLLKQMGKINMDSTLFVAMEDEIKKTTQNFLLIGKYVDAKTGKVNFKIKLVLPTTANKPSNMDSLIVTGNKDGTPCNETLTKEQLDKMNSYANDYSNAGNSSKISAELSTIQFLHTELYNINLRCAKFYTPSGGVVKIDGFKAFLNPSSTSKIIDFPGGALYGFTILKNNEEIQYSAYIDKNIFKGYAKIGTTQTAQVEYFNTTSLNGVQYDVIYLVYDDCSIEARSSQLLNPINNNNLPVIPDIGLLPNFQFNDNKIAKIVSNSCGLAKKLEEYYEFFPKTYGYSIKSEDLPALKDLCTTIAKLQDNEIFKSKQDAFINQYIYHDVASEDIVSFIDMKTASPFDKFAVFFAKSFFPEDYGIWNKYNFVNAKNKIDIFLKNQPIFIDKCNKEELSEAVLLDQLKTLFPIGYFEQLNNKALLHLIFDRITDKARLKLINALLTIKNGDNVPGVLKVNEKGFYLPILILTTPNNTVAEKALLANFDTNKYISLDKQISNPLVFYQVATLISQMMLNNDDQFKDTSLPSPNIFEPSISLQEMLALFKLKGTVIPFGFDFSGIESIDLKNNTVKFIITSPDIVSFSGNYNKTPTFTVSLDRPIFIFSSDTYVRHVGQTFDIQSQLYTPEILQAHNFTEQHQFGLITIPALMLYALEKKSIADVRKAKIVRIVQTTLVVVTVASIVVTAGTMTAPTATAATVAWGSLSLFVNTGVFVELTLSPSLLAQYEEDHPNFMLVYRAAMILDIAHGGFELLKAKFGNISECEKALEDAAKAAEQKGNTALAKALRAAKSKLTGCFTPNTPILTEYYNTFKPIKYINIGDKIASSKKITKGYAATLAQNNKVAYLALDNEINLDPYTSADQKALDKLDYSSIETQIVTLSMPKANGSISEIQLLRPTTWLEQNGIAALGKSTYLHLPEMGLEGFATVADLAHFRVTKSDTATEENSFPFGEGRDGDWTSGMVTGVFRHVANSVYHLRYDNGDSLGVTGTHPLYSLDRQQFIPVTELRIGEKLLSKSGAVTLTKKIYDPTEQEVYNLEVGQWHNFLVGRSGVVAHNNYLGCLTSQSIEGVETLSGIISKNGDELNVVISLIYRQEGYTGKVFQNLTNHLDVIAKANNAQSQKIIFETITDVATKDMYTKQAAIYGFKISYKQSPISAPGFPAQDIIWTK